MVEEEGSQGLEASVQPRGGMGEEVVAASIIHGVISGIVTRFLRDPTFPGEVISRRIGKICPGRWARERPVCLERRDGGPPWIGSRRQGIARPESQKSKEKQVTFHCNNPGKSPGKSRVGRETVIDFSSAEIGVKSPIAPRGVVA
jgi:hypothetical protein